MKNLTYSRLILYLFSFVLIILFSCEKDDKNSAADALIKSQLIGTWNSTNYYHKTMVFNQDNTFIDTTFDIYGDKPNEFQVGEVIRGNYTVEDNQLKVIDTKLAYFKGQESSLNMGFTTSYEPLYNLILDGDNLTIEPKVLLTSIGKSNSTIIGKWSTQKVIAVYDNNLNNKYTGGIMKVTWEFKADLSAICSYDYIYDNIIKSYNESLHYEFNDPDFSIKEYGFNAKAYFTNNQMIWTYYASTYKRKQ
jgi:hypothetical protein